MPTPASVAIRKTREPSAGYNALGGQSTYQQSLRRATQTSPLRELPDTSPLFGKNKPVPKKSSIFRSEHDDSTDDEEEELAVEQEAQEDRVIHHHLPRVYLTGEIMTPEDIRAAFEREYKIRRNASSEEQQASLPEFMSSEKLGELVSEHPGLTVNLWRETIEPDKFADIVVTTGFGLVTSVNSNPQDWYHATITGIEVYDIARRTISRMTEEA